jgi:hypothetical protein
MTDVEMKDTSPENKKEGDKAVEEPSDNFYGKFNNSC